MGWLSVSPRNGRGRGQRGVSDLKKTDFVVRFAGEGGAGVVTSAEGFAQANAQVGYHVPDVLDVPIPDQGRPGMDANTHLDGRGAEFG